MLKTHGRYDYSAISKRPDYSFPGGKRLAIHLGLNVEHILTHRDQVWITRPGEICKFIELLPAGIVPGS